MRRNSDDMVGPVMQASSVVKLLSKRWWIHAVARLEGPKLEPMGREQMWVPDRRPAIFEHLGHSVWLL